MTAPIRASCLCDEVRISCGSPLYSSSARHPDRVNAKAGILDDPAIVRPASPSGTRSRVDWATLDPALPAQAKD